MSGGRAFVLDENHDFPARCNLEMVDLEPLARREDLELVRDLLTQHAACTGSPVAMRLLQYWKRTVETFVTVMPLDQRRVLAEQNLTAPDRSDHGPNDEWWHERYPGHLRVGQAHSEPVRMIPVEAARG